MPNTPGIHDEAEVEKVARAIYPKIAWAYKFGPVPFEELNEHAVASLKEVAILALSAIDVAGIRARLHDAEMSLAIYDDSHSSEYWLRYPNGALSMGKENGE